MGVKVQFIGSTRTIQVTLAPDASGSVYLDFRTDVYSDGKEDWQLTASLGGMKFPVRPIGGDPISNQVSLGATFFLDFGWRIAPYEADHDFLIEGNVYTAEGDNPVLNTVGSYNVRTELVRSNIIDQVSSAADIANAVWLAPLSEYSDDLGSMGLKVIRIASDNIFTK